MAKSQKIVFNLKPGKKPISRIVEVGKSTSTDLLGDLLTNQEVLTSRSEDIEISREGKLRMSVCVV